MSSMPIGSGDRTGYTASLTSEQFLFYEMRTTARLVCEGLAAEEVISQILSENLFQYPTEKSVRKIARCCLRRLETLENDELTRAIAEESGDVAKQICLYAMMRQYRIVREFMVTVIGEKFRQNDLTFHRRELNVFFLHLQEQQETAAGWSESTVAKLKQVLMKLLVENAYLDDSRAEQLHPVWLHPLLKQAILRNGDTPALAAFNDFPQGVMS